MKLIGLLDPNAKILVFGERIGRILRQYEGKDISSLYYLYVKDSSEEPAYLASEAEVAAFCELSYSMEADTFSCPSYEKRGRAALRAFRKKNPNRALLAETKRCLACGMVRPDWLLGDPYCTRKIQAAKTRQERNYWICMRQMASPHS